MQRETAVTIRTLARHAKLMTGGISTCACAQGAVGDAICMTVLTVVVMSGRAANHITAVTDDIPTVKSWHGVGGGQQVMVVGWQMAIFEAAVMIAMTIDTGAGNPNYMASRRAPQSAVCHLVGVTEVTVVAMD